MSSQPHETTQADVLRDARLIQAMWHMPDAHDMPDAALRSRVLQAAGDALLPPATAQPVNAAKITLAQQLRNAWRTGWCWLADPSSERMPWTGALASLLLASLITVMWTGREPPETPAQGDPGADSGRRPATARPCRHPPAIGTRNNARRASHCPAARCACTPCQTRLARPSR